MKTYAEYLAQHNGDAALAGAAMERDARAEQSRLHGENATARATARQADTLLRTLGQDPDSYRAEGLSPERRAELMTAAFTAAGTRISELSTAASIPAEALTAVGIDSAAYLAAGKEKRAEMLATYNATHAGAAEQLAGLQGQITLRDAGAALGVDPKKLSKILPKVEMRKVKGEDGKEVDTWGVPGEGDAFTTVETALKSEGFSMADLKPAAVDATVQGAAFAGQAPAAAAQPAGLLSFLDKI